MTLHETTYPTPPYYIGVFEDGEYVSNLILSDLAQIPGVTYIVKTIYVGYNFRKFTLVKPDGTLNLLRKGYVEILDISNELYDKQENQHKVDLTFFDYKDNQRRVERINSGQRADFMLRELLKLLSDLNEAGSYNLYVKLSKQNELEEENRKLKEEVANLKLQLKSGSRDNNNKN